MGMGRIRDPKGRAAGWLLLGILVVGFWLLNSGAGDGIFGFGAPDGLTEAEVAERGGSAEPCAVPLGWRIGEIDPRFGISEADARAAASRAALYWESVVGEPVLLRDTLDGLPIRFVFDERQEALQERLREGETLAELDRDLDRRRLRLDRDFSQLDQDLERHNERVREWNARGGAPPEVMEAIRQAEASMEAREQELRERSDRLNRAVTERNREWEVLADEFPARLVESGRYGEQVRIRRGRVARVFDREIRVFYFDRTDELALLLAHEMGHALGLGHTEVEGAVMNPVQTGSVERSHPGDVQLLSEICPGLSSTPRTNP